MGYEVTTALFTGPIDRLLQEVSSHQIDIVDLPLAPIIDAFLEELLNRRDTLSMDTVSEFLLVGSILVELKSQRLLPGPEAVEEDEELARWEERDLLLARLLEGRAYAAAADVFVVMAEAASLSIAREVGLDPGFEVHAPDLLEGVVAQDLADAFAKILEKPDPPRVDLSHVTIDTETVAQVVGDLAHDLPSLGRTSFRALVAGAATRLEVIVRFLALLELCKLGKVELGQGETFGELSVEWIGDSDDDGVVLTGAMVDDYDG